MSNLGLGKRNSVKSNSNSPTVDFSRLLVTGPYVSARWIDSYLVPILEAFPGTEIALVSDRRFDIDDRINCITTPKVLRRSFGRDVARIISLIVAAVRFRPTTVLGLHLELHAMLAIVLARVTSSSALYFNIGGRSEIECGGLLGGQRLFESIQTCDRSLENKLLKVVDNFDAILTMGTNTQAFLYQNGISRPICPACVGSPFTRSTENRSTLRPKYDLICVARLEPVKRVDQLLVLTSVIRESLPGLRVAIIGDGSCRNELEHQSSRLRLEKNVEFLGWKDDVVTYLSQARIFVLTSRSEGLPISAIEAMSFGLPCVLPNVGDTSDLVVHDQNGWLFSTDEVQAIAPNMISAMSDRDRYGELSAAAKKHVARYSVSSCARRWRDAFSLPGD